MTPHLNRFHVYTGTIELVNITTTFETHVRVLSLFACRNGLLFLWAAALYDDSMPPDLQILDELAHEDQTPQGA